MNSAIILHVDGRTTDLGHKPTLEEAQKIVGGYVEVAHCLDLDDKRCQLIVNEEGHIHGLPRNERATTIYRNWPAKQGTPTGHFIVGDVIRLRGWRFG